MTISTARRAATFALLGASAFLVACSSGVKLDDVDGTGTGSSAADGKSSFGSQPWNDPKSPLFEKSIYFGLDEFTVETKYLGY
jgi:peptidoglycan-associated lipoprotein